MITKKQLESLFEEFLISNKEIKGICWHQQENCVYDLTFFVSDSISKLWVGAPGVFLVGDDDDNDDDEDEGPEETTDENFNLPGYLDIQTKIKAFEKKFDLIEEEFLFEIFGDKQCVSAYLVDGKITFETNPLLFGFVD